MTRRRESDVNAVSDDGVGDAHGRDVGDVIDNKKGMCARRVSGRRETGSTRNP